MNQEKSGQGKQQYEAESLLNLSREELAKLERQLIPLLNTVRQLQGKRPVIVPSDNRAHD